MLNSPDTSDQKFDLVLTNSKTWGFLFVFCQCSICHEMRWKESSRAHSQWFLLLTPVSLLCSVMKLGVVGGITAHSRGQTIESFLKCWVGSRRDKYIFFSLQGDLALEVFCLNS